MALVMTVEEIDAFVWSVMPGVEGAFVHEEVGDRRARLRLPLREDNLRPGGTVCGPALMALADHAAWVVLLAHVGPEALAVTVNLSIDFLRKPLPADVIAEARLLKLGRRLSVTDVLLYSEGEEEPVARASVTYALPSASIGGGA
ncbi:MAG: PaaI family thioesterase [Acidimicrobiia bacterium]|nr:PaaI family thioesterase [Acidimicrobiia bacterium]